MSPAPGRKHQGILIALATIFYNYLEDKPCEVYASPFDVRLPDTKEKTEDEDIITVVQPDILIVCDKSKLDDRGLVGAPDLVVEILSPSTAAKDYTKKIELYERHKVKEYWIVHPIDKIVTVYTLTKNGKYGKPGIYSDEDKVSVGIFRGDLEVNLKQIFKE